MEKYSMKSTWKLINSKQWPDNISFPWSVQDLFAHKCSEEVKAEIDKEILSTLKMHMYT